MNIEELTEICQNLISDSKPMDALAQMDKFVKMNLQMVEAKVLLNAIISNVSSLNTLKKDEANGILFYSESNTYKTRINMSILTTLNNIEEGIASSIITTPFSEIVEWKQALASDEASDYQRFASIHPLSPKHKLALSLFNQLKEQEQIEKDINEEYELWEKIKGDDVNKLISDYILPQILRLDLSGHPDYDGDIMRVKNHLNKYINYLTKSKLQLFKEDAQLCIDKVQDVLWNLIINKSKIL